MSVATPRVISEAIEYPDSDGQPMAENTQQFRMIVAIHGNIAIQEQNNANVFVAGDNLIYPVRGCPEICMAPDVYVAIGRPKGDRGSYKVWEENGIFPQVIFEVLSPGNRAGEMARKLGFYEQFGAEEYYIIDPDRLTLKGYYRSDLNAPLKVVRKMKGHVSPRLGIRFDIIDDAIEIFRRDGTRFLTMEELGESHQELVAKVEQQRDELQQWQQQALQQKERIAQLEALLRQHGIRPGESL